MADITLPRPEAGRAITVAPPSPEQANARLLLDFAASDAEISRAGDNLIFKFGDGAEISLENFYTTYNSENIPEFQIDGQLIAGADFFSAFAPDIAPAAGPGAGASGGRYNNYGTSDLAGGIDHLGELDWGMDTGAEYTDDEEADGLLAATGTGAGAGGEEVPAPDAGDDNIVPGGDSDDDSDDGNDNNDDDDGDDDGGDDGGDDGDGDGDDDGDDDGGDDNNDDDDDGNDNNDDDDDDDDDGNGNNDDDGDDSDDDSDGDDDGDDADDADAPVHGSKQLVTGLDESAAIDTNEDGKPDTLTGSFVLENLDYDTQAGIADVVWNEAMTEALLRKVTDDLLGADIARPDGEEVKGVSVSEDGKTLTIEFTNGATVEMVINDPADPDAPASADNPYTVTYTQTGGLEHPLGGLLHDDKLALPVVADSIDGDGDRAHNFIGVVVDDDGPKPLLESNVGMLDSFGDTFLSTLYDELEKAVDNAEDSGDPNAFLNAVGAAFTAAFADAASAGLSGNNGDNIADLAQLILGGSTTLGAAVGSSELTTAALNSTLYLLNLALETAKLDVRLSAEDSLDSIAAKLEDLPEGLKNTNLFKVFAELVDTARDAGRNEGGTYEGSITPDFGYDGPAEENPVQWDARGMDLLMAALGIKATGDDNPLRVDTASSTPTELVLVGDDGEAVLTLTLTANNNGVYDYSIAQAVGQGLEHNATQLESLLTKLLEAAGDLTDDATADGLSALLAGLGLDPALVGMLTAGLDPTATVADLLAKLGSGNLLTLPLPIVITDADGDTANGMIAVTVRDSVPTAGTAGATLTEPMQEDGAAPTFAGTLPHDFGVDQDGATLGWSTDDLPELKSNNAAVTWALDNGNLVGTAGGETIITVSAPNEHGNYTITQSGPLDNPDDDKTGSNDPLNLERLKDTLLHSHRKNTQMRPALP